MYLLVVVWVGKLIQTVNRLSGSGGSALPGLVVEKIYPKFILKISRRLSSGSIMVTGTNGKTTTTKLINGVLKSARKEVITNRAGSNMSRGIASALLEHISWGGKLRGEIGVFEVDEAFCGDVASKLSPKIVVVLNLLRDQLDRYGELDRTAELIAAGLQYTEKAVLNADDPLVAGLAKFVPEGKVVFFGAAPDLKANLPHDEDLLKAKRAGRAVQKAARLASKLNFLLNSVTLEKSSQTLFFSYEQKPHKAKLQLAGIYNAYNGLAALAVTCVAGISPTRATKAIAGVGPAFGRTELVKIGDKQLQLLLVKNPAGFNQIIRTFLLETKEAPLLIAVNDNFADGRDVSWLWDVDFEQMNRQHHKVLAGGLRGYDLAVRLKYADIESTTNLKLKRALSQFMKDIPAGATAYIIPTYTAMLELRQLLARKTKLPKAWQPER